MTQDITGREIQIGDVVLVALVRDRTARMKIGIAHNLPGNNRLTVNGFERDLRTGDWTGGGWRNSEEPKKGTISYASVKALILEEYAVPQAIAGRILKLRDEVRG